MDVLILLCFVSFPGLKNDAYTCVMSLFRRAFAPFYSFTVLVSTRGFERASPSRIRGPGDIGFKERVMSRVYELCHSRSVLVSEHCFKNKLCFLCSVLVLTHRFKNDLCVPCLFRLTALRTSSVAC